MNAAVTFIVFMEHTFIQPHTADTLGKQISNVFMFTPNVKEGAALWCLTYRL